MNRRVLIADDELFMLRLLEATLRKGGYQITTCRSGEEAWAEIQADPPDLVVLDLVMPGMDGFTALKHMQTNPITQNIPVIVLSGKGEAITGNEAQEAGARLFLSKPFSPTQLLHEVRKILGT